jgi:tetratricopeptide (TPR) repeat protein
MSGTKLPILLLSSLLLIGCPKQTTGPTVDEEQMSNPAYVFEAAKAALQPDRRGVINYETSYEYFRKCAEDLNCGPKAHFNAGWVAERLGKNDAAEKHYRAAFEADKTYEPAMFSVARVLKTNGKPGEAAEVYASYLTANPGNDEVRTEYMDALVAADRFDEAIAEGQQILRKNPNSDAVYRSLSGLYLRQGKLAMAQIMGDKALELNDADPNVYNNMGVVFLQQDDLPGAIDKFQMARKLDSKHYEANMNLGLIALDSGDYRLGLECFDKALETNPSSIDARLGRAVALRGTGDLAGAGKLYDELIKEDPKLKDAYFNAATLHRKYTKDFTKALKYLEAYKDAYAGTLSPTDEVFKLIEAVAAEKAAEEERKRLEIERKKEEEERKRRALETLEAMKADVATTQARVTANMACLPEEISMEVSMLLEQITEIIAAGDTDSAAEIQQMLTDYYVPMLDEAIATSCGGAAGSEEAPPPEGAGEGEPAAPEGSEPAAPEEPAGEPAPTP